MINYGYFGCTIKLSINDKNASFGKLVVNNVDIMLHVNFVNVMFLLLIYRIIYGSFYSNISYTFCKNLLFAIGNYSKMKLIQWLIIL